MNELGELLRELRGKEALRSVAERTGLSHSYISDIEKGFRRGTKTPIHPSVDTLKRLADAYGYSLSKLMEKAGYLSNLDAVTAKKVKEQAQLVDQDTYDSLSEINKLVKKYGIEQMGFFDIEEWKNLGPQDVKMIEEHFKMIVKLAKERNEEKD